MKVAIYCRVSTEEQNPENQLKDCRSVNLYGESIEIEDKQSAWNDNKEREGFEKLRKIIKSGEINHLIVWDFDRIYRNRNKFKEFLLFLKAYKVQLHSFRQGWFENLNKIPEPWNEIVYELMINIYGYIAEEESKKKSERVKLATRIKNGVKISYKGNKWGRKELPKSTIEMVLELNKKGYTLRKIADEVKYWDNSNHQRNISKSAVHKILIENKGKNNRKEEVY
jgi:DNA invertase Pin-like site-specific DNA recombinase